MSGRICSTMLGVTYALHAMTQTLSVKTQLLQVGGMDCGGCAKTIEASLQKLPGVKETQVSFATGRLTVTYNVQEVSETAIFDRVTALGYTAKQILVVNASDTNDSSANVEKETHSGTKPTDTTRFYRQKILAQSSGAERHSGRSGNRTGTPDSISRAVCLDSKGFLWHWHRRSGLSHCTSWTL